MTVGIEPNTDECHTLAIIACGASIITSVVIVALGVVVLFYLIPLAICLFFCYCTKVNSAYYMLIAIAVSAIVSVLDYKNGEKKEA